MKKLLIISIMVCIILISLNGSSSNTKDFGSEGMAPDSEPERQKLDCNPIQIKMWKQWFNIDLTRLCYLQEYFYYINKGV